MKFIKKISIFVLLILSVCTFSACKDKEKEESQEVIFAKYKVAHNNFNSQNEGIKLETKTSVTAFGLSEVENNVTTINSTNDIMASVSKNSAGDIIKESYIVKTGEKYVHYSYEIVENIFEDTTEHEYNAYYVGKDFINILDKEDALHLFDIRSFSVESYDKFKESFVLKYKNSLTEEYSLTIYPIVEITTFKFSNDGSNYKLNCELKSTIDGVSTKISIEIKFSENYINYMSVKNSASLANGKIETNFYKGYDDSLMPTDFSNFVSDGEIENAEFMIKYHLDGDTFSYEGRYDEYTFGTLFVPHDDIMEDEIVENTTLDGWYLDKDCTVSINTLTDYPSYDLSLYAKSKPNDGYAVIVYELNIKEEGNLFFWPDYETIAYEVNTNNSINLLDIVDENATIGDVYVNGSIHDARELAIEEGGYYLVKINGTVPAN